MIQNLIGRRIFHINFGFGEIVEQLSDKIRVRFDNRPREVDYLIFPSKNFRTYFKFVDENLNYEVHKEILTYKEFLDFLKWWSNGKIPMEVLEQNQKDDSKTCALKYVLREFQKHPVNRIDVKYVKKVLSTNLTYKLLFVKSKTKLDDSFFEALYRYMFILDKHIWLIIGKNCLRKYKSPDTSFYNQIIQKVPEKIKLNSNFFEFKKLSLYVYSNLNNIKCKDSDNHDSEPVTITTVNKDGKTVSFNSFQCKKCLKIYSDFDTAKKAFENLNYPLIKIVMLNEGELRLKEFSELSIYGYNVRENIYTDQQRHDLLATLMFNDILSKEKILTILQWLIKFNGKNSNCTEAVVKWKKDFSFVANYNIELQKQVMVKDIKIL